MIFLLNKMFTNGLNIERKHSNFPVKKVPSTAVSKEGRADSLLGHEFLERM